MVSTSAVALSITFPILAILAVCGRFYSRVAKKVDIRADDWMILPGLLCGIGVGILGLIGAYDGDLGVIQPKGPNGFSIISPKFVTFEKVLYAGTLLTVLCPCFARLSILLFYRRIFVGNIFTKLLWVNFALQAFWGVAWFFTYVFQCVPISELWSLALGERKHCWATQANYVYAISNIIMDVLVLVMPQTMLWRLQMSFRQKVAVSGIFLLGGIVIAMGIGKTVAFYNVAAQISRDHDTTYDEAPLYLWTIPEGNLAVVCACLPMLRPVFSGLSLESIIRSIRSAVSLRSLDSRGSTRNRTANTFPTGQGGDSATRIVPSLDETAQRQRSKESSQEVMEGPYSVQAGEQQLEYELKNEAH